MYSMAIYKYHTYCGTCEEKETVLAHFMDDIKIRKPTSVTENRTRVFVSFHDNTYQILYTLPIEYKKHVERWHVA